MNDTTNWRTMDAGRDLDWLIAQQLGWRVDVDPVHVDTFAYFIPDGSVSEDARMLSQEGVRNWRYSRLFPSYSTDLNAAFALVSGIQDVRIFTARRDGVNGWNAILQNKNEIGVGIEWAKTPALAICRALLDWKEAQS